MMLITLVYMEPSFFSHYKNVQKDVQLYTVRVT